MRCAIMGGGMAGAFLYRLLRDKIPHLHIYDVKPSTRCGITPCAWGTSHGFEELVRQSGLDPSDYILNRSNHVILQERTVGADLLVFNKQALVNDLLSGAEVRSPPADVSRYDRIIDATGSARAFLPPIGADLVFTCVQHRVRNREDREKRVRLGRGGYAWQFPLSPGEYHIGCGSFAADARVLLKELGWMNNGENGNMVCSCQGRIRLTGLPESKPFFVRANGGPEIWGVGESIGCVAPLAGDGIVPGMTSARILRDHWDDPVGYENALLREFKWMKGERKVLDKLRKGETLALTDVVTMRNNMKRMGVSVPIRDAAAFLACLR